MHTEPLFHSATDVSLDDLMRCRSLSQSLRQSTSRKRFLGERAGLHTSYALGRGLDFAEVRAYQVGDDARMIDWRVTARRGRPHTKLFHEERDRPVVLAIDLRPSMFFGTQQALKSVLGLRLAALLAWRAILSGDRVGAFLHMSLNHREVRPRAGQKSLMAVFHHMVEAHAKAPRQALGDNFASMLKRLVNAAPRSHQVLIISDFYGFSSQALQHFSVLCQHNQVLALRIIDPLERALPPDGVYPVQLGAEKAYLDSRNARLHTQYTAQFDALETTMAQQIRSLGAGFVCCSGDQSLLHMAQAVNAVAHS